MKKLIVIALLFLTLLALALSLRQQAKQPTLDPNSPTKITLYSSIYPLAFFAQQVGGEAVSVTNLTPAGMEPHDFEPTPQQMAELEQAQLLILNGLGMEPWAERAITTWPENKPRVLISANSLKTRQITDDGKKMTDPHVWLDPVLAQEQVKEITASLVKVDPDRASYYQQNGITLIQQLTELDQAFKTGLANCQQSQVITSHAAFGYLADRYSFQQVPISGLSPEAEPSPQTIAQLATLAKQKNIRYIFFETLISPQLAETLAKEVGAETLVFNPLEGLTREDEGAGKNYFSIQRENLANLRVAMSCQ